MLYSTVRSERGHFSMLCPTLSPQSCFLLSDMRDNNYLEIGVCIFPLYVYNVTVYSQIHKNAVVFILLISLNDILNVSTATCFLYSLFLCGLSVYRFLWYEYIHNVCPFSYFGVRFSNLSLTSKMLRCPFLYSLYCVHVQGFF